MRAGDQQSARLSSQRLLVLATAHCVLSIFYTNYCVINLAAYANGHERMPFQGRFLMSLVLRATQHSHALLKLVPRFTQHVPALEPFTVYKLTSLIVALISAIGLGTALALALAACLMILATFYFANWVESRAWIE